MNWKAPNLGDVRHVYKFLIFPKKLWNFYTSASYMEYRWLERVYVRQIYDENHGWNGWKDYAYIDWKKDLNKIEVKS